MTKKQLCAALCVFAAAFAAACGSVGDRPENHDHRCQLLSTGGNWAPANLAIFHNDTRQCPFAPLLGEVISSGGTIEDMNASPPFGDPESVIVTAYAKAPYSCQPYLNQASATFAWMDWDYDAVDDWAAQPSVAFTARTGADNAHDCLDFQVAIFNTSVPASALVMLHYFGEQFLRASANR